MIEHIITNTQLMTKEAMQSEQSAIDSFTKLVQAVSDAQRHESLVLTSKAGCRLEGAHDMARTLIVQ